MNKLMMWREIGLDKQNFFSLKLVIFSYLLFWVLIRTV